jgi:hypothetical protein
LADFSGATIAGDSFDTIVDPKGLTANLAKRIARLLKAHKAA